jgi:hypothetical protein
MVSVGRVHRGVWAFSVAVHSVHPLVPQIGDDMFWYVISLNGKFEYEDDVSVTDDRGAAVVAMIVCGLKVKCCAK